MPETENLDAREMLCTQMQRCAYYAHGIGPVVYGAQPVVNFWAELERRGEDHVMGCAGIYPTGRNPDGSARFDGEICQYGTEGDTCEGDGCGRKAPEHTITWTGLGWLCGRCLTVAPDEEQQAAAATPADCADPECACQYGQEH